MTRAALLFTLALFSALIAVAGIAASGDPGARNDYAPTDTAVVPPPSAVVSAVLPGQQSGAAATAAKNATVQTARQIAQQTGHGAIECVQVRFADGATESIPAGCAAVVATETPIPTVTPPPTSTPRPTLTPAVTASKAPPPTNTAYPTPTADNATLPPLTPSIPKCDVRAGPGVRYYPQPTLISGAIGYLATGVTYYPLSLVVADDNLWAFIPGKGYAAASVDFPIFDNEACRDLLPSANTPVPTSAAPTPTPIGTIYACTDGQTYLNIRQGPGTSYGIVGQLLPTQKVQIVTQLDTGWWEVWYGGLPGRYIAGWLAREC